MYVWAYVRTQVHTRVRTCVRTNVRTDAYMNVSMYVGLCVCMYVFVCACSVGVSVDDVVWLMCWVMEGMVVLVTVPVCVLCDV